MGGIAQAFTQFAFKWNTAPKIAGEPALFLEEAKAVIRVLQERVHRENAELYPAAELC